MKLLLAEDVKRLGVPVGQALPNPPPVVDGVHLVAVLQYGLWCTAKEVTDPECYAAEYQALRSDPCASGRWDSITLYYILTEQLKRCRGGNYVPEDASADESTKPSGATFLNDPDPEWRGVRLTESLGNYASAMPRNPNPPVYFTRASALYRVTQGVIEIKNPHWGWIDGHSAPDWEQVQILGRFANTLPGREEPYDLDPYHMDVKRIWPVLVARYDRDADE